jgi:hypothetical protein
MAYGCGREAAPSTPSPSHTAAHTRRGTSWPGAPAAASATSRTAFIASAVTRPSAALAHVPRCPPSRVSSERTATADSRPFGASDADPRTPGALCRRVQASRRVAPWGFS